MFVQSILPPISQKLLHDCYRDMCRKGRVGIVKVEFDIDRISFIQKKNNKIYCLHRMEAAWGVAWVVRVGTLYHSRLSR